MNLLKKGELMEEKIKILSKTIVDYSINVQPRERVLICYQSDECKLLIKQLINDISLVGGFPFIKRIDNELDTLLTINTTEDKIPLLKEQKRQEVENYDSFIQIRYTLNEYENNNIDNNIQKMIKAALRPYDKIRINERKWVLLNYPSLIDAYKAAMPTDQFKQFAFDVMTIDYKSMYEKMKPLKELMEKTDKVRLVAPDTDITFSIKNMPAIPCCGTSNIPDGEIYTAPIRDSVNGTIAYNVPSPYNGNIFHNVKFTFKEGQIVAFDSDDNQKLRDILDTDEGSRYIGEFAIGLNPKVKKPMGDILYDEKIIGSIHFTPGCCYDDASNGNYSAIHWDLVLIQTEEYGGGEIYFDDVLIRKNGKFVIESLKTLNYE